MKRFFIVLSLALFVQALGTAWGHPAKDPIAEKYSASLKKIFDLDVRFAPLHPVLGKVYPVAIVENKTFYIFDPVPAEWDYLTWQEWKEGLARYLENRMREVAGLPENKGGENPPFNRVTFYRGGDKLIRFLERRQSGIVNDLEKLYRAISAPPAAAAASAMSQPAR